MRAINQKARDIIDALVVGLCEDHPHRKIDNNPPSSGYMPVSINWLGDTPEGVLFSVAHYYEQNGDLMADPDMGFIRIDDKYYPTSWRMDGLGVYRECVVFGDDGRITGIDPRDQRDNAVFAGEWMQNIKIQQHLGRR